METATSMEWPIRCDDCGWQGTQAQMMVSGHKPKPYCPKCGGMDLTYDMHGDRAKPQ